MSGQVKMGEANWSPPIESCVTSLRCKLRKPLLGMNFFFCGLRSEFMILGEWVGVLYYPILIHMGGARSGGFQITSPPAPGLWGIGPCPQHGPGMDCPRKGLAWIGGAPPTKKNSQFFIACNCLHSAVSREPRIVKNTVGRPLSTSYSLTRFLTKTLLLLNTFEKAPKY